MSDEGVVTDGDASSVLETAAEVDEDPSPEGQVLAEPRRVMRFRHPVVGPLELTYYSLQLSTSLHDVHTLTTYTAQPGSPSEDRFKLLASFAATDHKTIEKQDDHR